MDWAFLGTAVVGEEQAPLVWASSVLAGEHADRARLGSFGDVLDRWAAARPYLLDLADEARELIPAVLQ